MELILGFALGFLIGIGFAFVFVKTNRKKQLLSHLPALPYLLIFNLLLTILVVVLNEPYLIKLAISGLVGVESGQMLMAKKYRNSLN